MKLAALTITRVQIAVLPKAGPSVFCVFSVVSVVCVMTSPRLLRIVIAQ